MAQKSAMFLATIFFPEHFLQSYDIAQWTTLMFCAYYSVNNDSGTPRKTSAHTQDQKKLRAI